MAGDARRRERDVYSRDFGPTSLGSRVDDTLGPSAFAADGKLLTAPKFTGDVVIAGETHARGQLVIRLDQATGAALSAFAPGREFSVLLSHPTAGAYFAGTAGFGQLTPPP